MIHLTMHGIVNSCSEIDKTMNQSLHGKESPLFCMDILLWHILFYKYK